MYTFYMLQLSEKKVLISFFFFQNVFVVSGEITPFSWFRFYFIFFSPSELLTSLTFVINP